MDYSDIFNDDMFFRFNNDFVDVTFEHWVGNQLISIQKQRGPDMMLRSSFLQACRNVMGREPTKLILKRWEKIWSQIDQQEKVLELSIEFKNRNEKEWPE